MMRKPIFAFATSFIFSMTIISCSDSGTAASNNADSSGMNNTVANNADSMTNANSSMPAEQGVMVGGAMMVPSKNIVENAAGSADHTTLVAAVKAGGLA